MPNQRSSLSNLNHEALFGSRSLDHLVFGSELACIISILVRRILKYRSMNTVDGAEKKKSSEHGDVANLKHDAQTLY